MSPHEALEFERAKSVDTVDGSLAAAERNAVLHIPAALPGANIAAATASDSRSVPRVFSGTLFRKGTLSLIDQGVVSATNFLTMVLLGRTATQELGEYQLGFSIVLLAMCVQNALISSPYTLFGNRMEGRQRAQYAGSTLLHQWGLSALSHVGDGLRGNWNGDGLGSDGFRLCRLDPCRHAALHLGARVRAPRGVRSSCKWSPCWVWTWLLPQCSWAA